MVMKFNYLGILIVVLVCFSCKSEKKEKMKEPFLMYETSELATLMEEFYVYNDSLKSQIVNDIELSFLPVNFDEIHTAKMTDRFERDENFQQFVKVFQRQQKSIYYTPKDSLKIVYNTKIQTCIACHQTTCTGPIPRIQKLLIE